MLKMCVLPALLRRSRHECVKQHGKRCLKLSSTAKMTSKQVSLATKRTQYQRFPNIRVSQNRCAASRTLPPVDGARSKVLIKKTCQRTAAPPHRLSIILYPTQNIRARLCRPYGRRGGQWLPLNATRVGSGVRISRGSDVEVDLNIIITGTHC